MKFLSLLFIASTATCLACPFSDTSDVPPDDDNHKDVRGGRRRLLSSLGEDAQTRSAISEIIDRRSEQNRRRLQDSACVTNSIYSDIHDDVVSIADTLPNNRERGHFFGGIVRLAAHDFMDYDQNAVNNPNSQPLGPDGCLDFEHSANAGLPDLWCDDNIACPFKALYDNSYTFMSKADFWVAAANAVIDHTSNRNLVLPFRWGRIDTNSCDESSQRLPEPHGCSEVEATFLDRMGLTWRDAVALSGGHTLGRGDTRFSGHDGTWVDSDRESTRFNKRYYEEVVRRAWRPRQTNAGVNWTWGGNNRGVMMLNTDICLLFDIPDGNTQNCCTNTNTDCRDPSIQNSPCPSADTVRPEAVAAFREFLGGQNPNNNNEQSFYNAFGTSWTLATEIGYSDDSLFDLADTCAPTTPPGPTPTGPTPPGPTPTPPSGTPAPVANPTPSTCVDRNERWRIEGSNKNRNWCNWAASIPSETSTRCEQKDLFADCPVTCDRCSSNTPAPVSSSTPAPVSSSTPAPVPQGGPITAWMIDMLDQVNAQRASVGRHDLCYNEKTIAAAMVHNQDMVDNNIFSHTGSDGSSAGERLTAQDYTWSHVGENIAQGQTSVTAVMTSWMDSSGHRANILSVDFHHFGVAWDIGTNTWTQVFGNSGSETCISVSTPTPVASTPAPVASTLAPVAGFTQAPVTSPTGPSTCEAEINGRMANLESKVENIENMLVDIARALQP